MSMLPPFVIASNQRSGTTLFRRLLESTNHVNQGIPELTEGIIKTLKASYGTLSKRWGICVHARHEASIYQFCKKCCLKINLLQWIWLVRKDKVAQAMSHLRATATGIWVLDTRDKNLADRIKRNDEVIDIDESQLYRRVDRFLYYDQVWATFFERHKIKPYKLYYEDMLNMSDWDSIIESVLDFLSISYETPLNVSTPTIRQERKT